MKTNNYLIPLAVFAIALLLVYDYQKAYADIDIQIITPTGGTLSSASDCTVTTRSSSIIWHNCNNVLYAIDSTSYVALSSLAVTATTADRMLGSPDSNAVYFLSNAGNTITRYIYTGSAVVANGVYSPSGCSLSANLQYDAQGYMWTVCDSEDIILKFNPATMTEVVRSQDLTDGAGIECDLPIRIGYSATDNVGAIACSTTANTVMFKVASPTSITLTDSEATTSTIQTVVDDSNNRVLGFNGATISVYDYVTATGVTTLSQTVTVATDTCAPEYAFSSQKFIVCNDDSGTNTVINIVLSNTTGVFHLASSLVSGFDNSEAVGIDVSSGSFSTWFIASSVNNQRIIVVTGLRQQDAFTPTPPSGGTGDDDNNQVNGVCGNTDTNGDGRVNVLDCVGGSSPFSGITGGRNVTEITALVTNGIGLTACEEDGSDQDTCGSGLFTFVMLLLITEFLVLAGYLGLTRITNSSSDIMDIALLLVIMAFVDLAIAFYLNWIPDIIFYTIIVIVAGFLAFGLLKKFGRG